MFGISKNDYKRDKAIKLKSSETSNHQIHRYISTDYLLDQYNKRKAVDKIMDKQWKMKPKMQLKNNIKLKNTLYQKYFMIRPNSKNTESKKVKINTNVSELKDRLQTTSNGFYRSLVTRDD